MRFIRLTLICVGLLAAACALPETQLASQGPRTSPSPRASAEQATAAPTAEASVRSEQATVTRVVDGDTAVMSVVGRGEQRVRFTGVDTPESTTRKEPFGKEASNFTQERIDGREVWLEIDVEERDRYKRLLAYVWLAKPLSGSETEARASMFNAHLAAEGYATQLTIPPNVKYASLLSKLVIEARDSNKGLWASPVQTPELEGSGDGCDPSYPDVCIPSPPPDLNCPNISHRRFRVVGNDPHGFDRDGDGVGCES